jgi:hypothetical protein
MIDFHKELVGALQTVLPTHYELTLTSGTKVPCISYMELNNYVSANGDTRGYSYVSYQVKVWGHNIGEIQKYTLMIDEVLRPLGWKRTSSQELFDRNSTMIQKIMTFEALFHEHFN